MPKESGDFKAIVGANIRNLREFYGETQEQLAQIVGCGLDGGKNSISPYERGINLPHAETLRLIAAHYFVDVDSLLEENRFRLPEKGILQEPRAFREMFVSWFPVVSAAACEENNLFVRACSRQRTLYSYPYTLDLLSRKLFIRRKNQNITLSLDKLKSELISLKEAVSSFVEIASL